ncbi:PQQ-binding-like beta-propeller repeat protein [Rhodococcus sp. IEGM 1379]|uniref:outer membrane protein assembly factor BamB family protein n=1 Tax=Rhodococcus sp. IEGM 1379 TaxID=3047086 RepID=UPI0024B7B988|nr:PQQ-binding-like beta-propeller repeat protein [Rhodococcus sp. IEGM 1379]MDI9915767.1 PQQ-binding-like beta-propeller repeat protein [Rhodococcus sp. IEGM 1379]
MWIALVSLSAVLALAAGSVVAFQHFRNSDETVALPPGMTKGTFPTAPEVAWTADPHDYMSGPTASFINPEFDGRRYLGTGFLDIGDKIIAAVAKTQTDSNESRLIALNSRTGPLEWSAPSTFGGGCANDVVEGALPCIESDFGRNPKMKSFNVHDGSVRSESALSPNTLAISVGEGSVFTAAYGPSEGEYTLTKGTLDNPASDWSRAYSIKTCGVGSGDHYALKVSDGLVSLSGVGGVIAHTSDGSVVAEDTAWARPVPGFGAVAGRCDGNTNELTFTPTYFDSSGAVVFTSAGSVSPMDFVASARSDIPLIMSDGTARIHDGSVKWSIPQGDSKYFGSAAVLGDAVFRHGRSSTTALDLESGSTLWETSENLLTSSTEMITDGQNLIGLTGDGEIAAISASDGSTSWSVSTSDGPDSDRRVFGTAGNGFVYASNKSISMFEPTGPSSQVPDSVAAPSGANTDSGGDQYVTKFGSAPTFTPTDIITDTGGLIVTMRITATCPGGDILASDTTSISISDGAANVAAAVFDFSDSPLVLPHNTSGSSNSSASADESIQRTFRFPIGTFWRTPDTLSGKSGDSWNKFLVECVESGNASATTGVVGQQLPNAKMEATGPAAPQTGDAESAAFDALRALANADAPSVSSELADRWVPQLSSKRPGMVADGKTWNNSATLEEHLALRLKYPQVRLLWSGDWSVFSAPDFWITIAGVTFPDPDGALGWCVGNGLDRDHCYAKLVSKTHPIEGSTKTR